MSDNYVYAEYDQIEKVEFDVLGNSEKKRMSALGDGPGIESLENNSGTGGSNRGGLNDPRMGTSTNDSYCATCKLGTKGCPGHFGHIDLAEDVYHIGYLPFVHKFLSCICTRCSKLLYFKSKEDLKELLKTKSGKEKIAYVRAETKNATYCQNVDNEGNECGAPIPKIKIEVKKTAGSVNLVAETILGGDDNADGKTENKAEKKKLTQTLTPDMTYDILKNVSDDDCRILGMDPERSRPEDMILKIFPVPPIPMRPSVRGDFMGGAIMEDDLTHKLADIVKANARVIKSKETQTEKNIQFSVDNAHLLSYQVGTYLENGNMLGLKSSDNKGKQFKSLGARLKGKTGRVRGNLMGKRGDFTARTVITSDPTIENNKLGVPIKIAMNITFPEIVTPNNIEFLSTLVKNGMDVYPGANYVWKLSTATENSRILPIRLRFKQNVVELQCGDIVERHMLDDDILLLNRQPTLHKQSMMAHRAKIINDPTLMTYRLSVAITTPYNADFDKLTVKNRGR